MSTIRNFLIWLNGSRKLFLTAIGLGCVQAVVGITLALFIVSMILSTPFVNGDQLVEVFAASLKADGIILGVYCGANICSKGMERLGTWLAKKKR